MRRQRSLAANPVLIGAITTLVVIVAVFLAYNANQGLPFVPIYQLEAQVPSAANLVVGNDVRIAGDRVGQVTEISTVRHADGSVTAKLMLNLERSVKPLPIDSTVLVRPRSPLGLKYVEITEGTSDQGFLDGDEVPLANARPLPVELDEVFNMFNEPTRRAIRENLTGFGGAFAGRGIDLNVAIGDLPVLLPLLDRVMANLAAPRTQLRNFFVELGDAAAIVAPAAETQAALFVNLDTTFIALASVARPFIQESIARGPETLQAAIDSFPIQRPFLANSTALFAELRPGVAALRTSAPILADALEFGTANLPLLPAFNARLERTLVGLAAFSRDPRVPLGLRQLTALVASLRPTVATLEPTQSVCNYLTLWFRNVSSLLSEGDRNGTWQRFIIIVTPDGPNNEGGPSSAPADGPSEENHLHTNPYPNTAAPGEPRECEAGNEPYLPGQTVIGNTPGTQSDSTEATEVDG